MSTARVTVTLPSELVREIDQIEHNRSRFVLEALRHELQRRRRAALRRSLRTPHPEASELERAGFSEWASRLPDEEVSKLVDLDGGTKVSWIPGRGWTGKGR